MRLPPGGDAHLNWDAAEHNSLAADLRVAAALAERGYDFRFVLGDGGHDPNHARAILPDALRRLWRTKRDRSPRPLGAPRQLGARRAGPGQGKA